MRLPVTLYLKPSPTLGAALVAAHALVALGIALTGLPLVAVLVALLAIVLSLRHTLHRHVLRAPLVALTLRSDGMLEAKRRDGSLLTARVVPDTTVFPWLVVLLLEGEGIRSRLALPPDALGGAAHRQLRLWLRWRASAAAA
ncbi:MAG: protein YgfX [Ignavibacteria bacterium]